MKKNPFLDSVADNKNLAKKEVENPFIRAKKEASEKAEKNKRKSILFYVDDYEKIVALSKTEGETIVGLLNNLVSDKIENLSDSDRDRYNHFFKK